MSGEDWKMIFNVCAAIASAPAAFFWFQASALRLPPPPITWDPPRPEDDHFYQSLLKSARLNKLAAGCSGVAALCIGIATSIDVIPKLLGP